MKKPLSLSRGTEIDTERCVVNVGNSRFDLVLIAAARAREIAGKHRHDAKPNHANSCVSALLDVQNKLVGTEYLRKVS